MRHIKKQLDYQFPFKPLLITTLLVILMVPLLNADADRPNADEQLKAFNGVKNIHVNLTESYGDAVSTHLAVKETINRLVSAAGFSDTGPGTPLTLEIKLNGRALAKLYSIHGVGRGTKFFSGATINGSVALMHNNQLVVQKGFRGAIAPPPRVSGHSTPPYKKALSQSAFLRQIIGLLLKIRGNDLVGEFIKINDREIRKVAVETAGKLKISSAVDPIITLIKKPMLRIPGTIALALTEIGDPRAVAPMLDTSFLIRLKLHQLKVILAGLKNMDPQWHKHSKAIAMEKKLFGYLEGKIYLHRLNAITILGETYRPNALKPLLGNFTRGKISRNSAVEVLDRHEKSWRTLPAAQNFATELIKNLSHTKLSVRRETCHAIGAIGSPDGKVPLIDALKDSHWSVLLAAQEALDKGYPNWGSHEAAIAMIPYLEAGYKEAGPGSLKKGFLKIFASINLPKLTAYLIDTLNGKAYAQGIKLTAAKGLFKIKTPEALKCLNDNLAARSFRLTREFLSTICASSKPLAREILVGVLESGRKRNRGDALELLLQREDVPDKKELLDRYRQDSNFKVRQVVYKTLLKDPAPGLTGTLMARLQDSGSKLRKFTVEFLDEINKKNPLPLETLIQMLAVDFPPAHKVAYKAIMKLNKSSETCILCPYIDHENKGVRLSLYKILQRKPDRRALPYLFKSLPTLKRKEQARMINLLRGITRLRKLKYAKQWLQWWEKNKNNY